jgi:hypothetical protein
MDDALTADAMPLHRHSSRLRVTLSDVVSRLSDRPR